MKTEDLIRELQSEGERPPPELVAKILALGDTAVERLRETVRAACDDPDTMACGDIAAGILGQLRAREAAPDLFRFLCEQPEAAWEFTQGALARLADDALLDEMEAKIRDGSVDEAIRAPVVQAYACIAVPRSDLRARIVPVLTGLLTGLVARAAELSPPEREMVQWIVASLCDSGATTQRPLIDEAIKAGVAGAWCSTPLLDQRFRAAEKPRPELPFLETYRDIYESVEGEEVDLDTLDDDAVAPAPIVVVKIGRNDPCPCRSGKKYKKCCLDKLTHS